MSASRSLVVSFIAPLRLIGAACLWHPIVSLPMLLIGVLVCWAYISPLFPLWLAISLGSLAVLGALSLVPVVIELLLPAKMIDKRMAGDSRFLFMGFFFFLFLLGTGCCLFFISPLWLGINIGLACFILGFPLSNALSAVFATPVPNRPSVSDMPLLNMPAAERNLPLQNRPLPEPRARIRNGDADRKRQDYTHYITELLAPEDRAYWLARSPEGSFKLMQEIASSYFTGILPDGSPCPRGKDEARALTCYQKIGEVSESNAQGPNSVFHYSLAARSTDYKFYKQDAIAEAKLHLAILSTDQKPQERGALLESAVETESKRREQSPKQIALLVRQDGEVIQLLLPVPALPYPCIREKVAEIYAKGQHGIPRNIERAIHWYKAIGELSKAKQLEDSKLKLALLMAHNDEKSSAHAFLKDPLFDQNLLSLIFKTTGSSAVTEEDQMKGLEERLSEAEGHSKTPPLIYIANIEQLKKDILEQKDTQKRDQLLSRIGVIEAGFAELVEQYLSRLILPEDQPYWPKQAFKNLSALIFTISQIGNSYLFNQYPNKTQRLGKDNPAYTLICYGELFELYQYAKVHNTCKGIFSAAGTIRYHMGMAYCSLLHHLANASQVDRNSESKAIAVDIRPDDVELDKATLYKIARNEISPEENELLRAKCFGCTCKAFDEAAEMEPSVRENVAGFFAAGNPPSNIKRAIHWYRAAGNSARAEELERQEPMVSAKIQQLTGWGPS